MRRGVSVLATHAVLLGEVAELLGDAHPRVEPALLGHVPEAQPGVAIHDGALPAHLAAVGPGQPEDATHRGRLARAVRPEEAHDPSRASDERRAVERDDRPVAFGEIEDLEHDRPPPGHFLHPKGKAKPPDEPGVSMIARETDHWAVIVPFMSGWTSQMKP